MKISFQTNRSSYEFLLLLKINSKYFRKTHSYFDNVLNIKKDKTLKLN